MVAAGLKKKSRGGANDAPAGKPSGKQQKRSKKKGAYGFQNRRLNSRYSEDAEIKSLEDRIKAEAPKAGRGSFVGTSEKDKAGAKQSEEVNGPALTMALFKELPLSRATLSSLAAHKFVKLTEIQRGAIPHALAGRDILGEARTGSGKTLAFVVPLLELLFRRRWTRMDGLGALIVSPTRELAYQIFKVVMDVGAQHDLSAGVIMGGRELDEEQKSVSHMNILVATPGRLLQHLDESPGFDASNLQLLAIDEADRILDFGFQETLHHIFSHLPTERQTLLFSATLHTSVHRLGRAALKSPEIISVHRDAKSRTPDKLKQVYMTIPLEKKVDVLFSFLRTHSQKKLIVFVSACKQVRFLYEAFKQLKPGPAIMELHGRQSLAKRMITFNEFTERERAVALLCTDIAARGVDFPVVDWVVQLDCPDSVESYVHRVGRTARYESGGHAALFLLPSEEAFVTKLRAQRIDVKSITAKQGKVVAVERKLQSVVASDGAVKHLAQKAFISYIRSVMLMKDKEIFKVQDLPKEEFALSLGLVVVPSVPQLKENEAGQGNELKAKKNMSSLQRLKEKIKAKKIAKAAGQPDDDSNSEDPDRPAAKKLSKWERAQRRIAKMKEAAAQPAADTNEEDDLLRPVAPTDELAAETVPAATASRKRKLKIGKDGVALGIQGQHTFFAGSRSKPSSELAQLAEDAGDASKTEHDGDGEEARKAFLARVSRDLAERDSTDVAVSRARVQEQKRLVKKRRKEEEQDDESDSDDGVGVTLGGASPASSRSPSPSSAPSEKEEEEEAPPQSAPKPKRQVKARGKPPTLPAASTLRRDRNVEPTDARDDLGALEREALSKLSGLF